MPDRKYTYSVEIDAATTQAAARKLRDVFTTEMQRITTGGAAGGAAAETAKQQTAIVKAQTAQQTAIVKAAQAQELSAARAAQQQQTAIVKAEGAERAQAARAEADYRGEMAKVARLQIENEEKRTTAMYMAELRKREREEREAARTTGAGAAAGRGRTLGGALRGVDSFLALGVGGLAGYGAVQAGQALYGGGREGAEMERTAALYEVVTRRMGLSAMALTKTMQEASRGTLSEAQAQSTGLQILSQKWANTRTDITKDAGILTEAARKFAMLYPDSEGRAQSPNDVSAKLLSYIREGNKELVDQFNINNAAIAQAAGVPNENLTAEDRARGLFKILEEEIARLPDTMNTSIEEIQQAEAQFTDAMNRIKMALSMPTAQAASGAAYLLDRGAALTGNATLTQARNVIGSEANYTGPDPQQYLAAAAQYDAALAKNEEGAASFEAQLIALGEALANQGSYTDEQRSALDALSQRLQLVADGNDAYSRTMEKVTRAGVEQNTELLAIARAMASYEEMLISGQLTMPEYILGLQRLAEHLGVVANAAGVAAGMVGALNIATKTGGAVNLLGQYGVDVGGIADRVRARSIGDAAGDSSRGGRQTVDPLTGSIRGGKGDRSKAGDPYDTLGQEVTQRQEAEAAKAARAWDSAAKKTASAFEQAAEDAAGAFKSALEKVPGLFGTSSVTAEDMADAEAGTYQEKADEYLRQLRDEVLNGKDYAGVDLADIAGVAGINQGLDPKVQLRQIERMWDDSSLFANPDALRFINRDAVAGYQSQQAASAAGRENLYAYMGMGPDAGLTPEQRAAYEEMTGTQGRRFLESGGRTMALTVPGAGETPGYLPGEEEVKTAAADAGALYAAEMAKSAADGKSGAAFLDELLGGLDSSQIAGETAKTLAALGTSIFGANFSGYSSAAGEAEWPEPVIDGLLGQVLPAVFAAIEEQI